MLFRADSASQLRSPMIGNSIQPRGIGRGETESVMFSSPILARGDVNHRGIIIDVASRFCRVELKLTAKC